MVACNRPLLLLDKGVIQKRTAVDPTVASKGVFLLFPSFFALTRMPITSYRPTSQRTGCLHTLPPPPHHRPPLPLGLPSGHTAGMSGATDWHRPSGRWNAAVWISWRQDVRRCAPTTGRDTARGALRITHPALVEHMAAWDWDHETGPTSGGASPRASTGQTW